MLNPGQCCLHGRHVESRGLFLYLTVELSCGMSSEFPSCDVTWLMWPLVTLCQQPSSREHTAEYNKENRLDRLPNDYPPYQVEKYKLIQNTNLRNGYRSLSLFPLMFAGFCYPSFSIFASSEVHCLWPTSKQGQFPTGMNAASLSPVLGPAP